MNYLLTHLDDELAQRCRDLAGVYARVAARLLALQTTPDIGRPFDGEEGLRELVIGFGSSGYVALYRHDPADDAVYVLALRHQREAGYP